MTRPQQSFLKHWPTLMLGLALVWMLVNLFTPISSLIVLFHQAGYRAGVLTVEKIYHQNDFESGLVWGFHGLIAGQSVRLYAPELADGKRLGYAGLSRKYPPGSELRVWYNPEVTDTLFNHRTLRVLPYTEDLLATEIEQLFWWFKYCLFPFLVAWFLLARWKKRSFS